MIDIIKIDYIFFYKSKTKHHLAIIKWLEYNPNIPVRI